MSSDSEIDETSFAGVYAETVRPLRTRSYGLDVPERENEATILHTLLGIELKVGRRRFACPDLATARYLSIFARIGCREFAVPYDITKISTIADELETVLQRSLLVLETEMGQLTLRQRTRRRSMFFKRVRTDLAAVGPGEKMPEFKQSTKQREA
jgi:hypothetical protein